MLLAVCGAHLSGQPLNWQLTERGGVLVCSTQTAAGYRLYDLNEVKLKRPAMVRDPSCEYQIEIEVWELPSSSLGSLLEGIAAPLGLGSLELADGGEVKGFICEQNGVESAVEISHFKGWRNYLTNRKTKP